MWVGAHKHQTHTHTHHKITKHTSQNRVLRELYCVVVFEWVGVKIRGEKNNIII